MRKLRIYQRYWQENENRNRSFKTPLTLSFKRKYPEPWNWASKRWQEATPSSTRQCIDLILKNNFVITFITFESACLSAYPPLKAGPEIRIQVQVVYLGDSGQGMWTWCWGSELSLQRMKNCLAHELGDHQPWLRLLCWGEARCSFLGTWTCLKQEPRSFPAYKENLQANDVGTGRWPPPGRQKGLEGGWSPNSIPQKKAVPINSSFRCWYLISIFSLFSLLYNTAYISGHLFLSYQTNSFSLPMSLVLPLNLLYTLRKLRFWVYSCIVNSLTSTLTSTKFFFLNHSFGSNHNSP